MERTCPVCSGPLEAADIVCANCRDQIGEREEEKQLETELDEHAESEPSAFVEMLSDAARRSPWWCISFLVHLIALLVMWQWPYRPLAAEETLPPIAVDLVEEIQDDVEEQELYEPEEVVEDENIPIEDIPIHPFQPNMKDPGPDVDLPTEDELFKDDLRPIESIDPPSATPVFGLKAAGAFNRGIYSGRSDAGKARAIGGKGGSSYRAESAVSAGLRWLAKAQEKDGRWSCKRWDGGDHYDVGMTGLALLAFLGAGYTHAKGPYTGTVTRGLRWLKANQQPSGRFNIRTFYEQGIAAMACSEAYGLTYSPEIGRMAQKAIDYIVKVQPAHGGFRYGGAVPRNQGDMSVTGWQVMALKSGVCSELNVPFTAFDHTRTFLKNSFRKYGGSAYIVEKKESGAAVSAIGMLCRQFVGGKYDDEINQAAGYLMAHENRVKGPGRGKDRLVGDLYYTYYSVLAMFQYGGKAWTGWNKLFRDTLVRAQVRSIYDKQRRYIRGSWDPAKHQWGRRGGRVYCTAMAILCLEVYYRFLPVYKR